MGPVSYSGGSVTGLSWIDIKAWSDLTGVLLSNYELTVLRQLSKSYADQHNKSFDPECPCPWVDRSKKPVSADAIKSIFKGLTGGTNRLRKTNNRGRQPTG